MEEKKIAATTVPPSGVGLSSSLIGIRELTELAALGEEPAAAVRVVRQFRAAVRRARRVVYSPAVAPARPGPPPFFDFVEGCTAAPKKRALLAYISGPFRMTAQERQAAGHANVTQSVEIALAWNRLGYAVDVVDWKDAAFVPSRPYDAFMGQLDNFARILPLLDTGTTKIYYATRSHGDFEAAALEKRCAAIALRRGVKLRHPKEMVAFRESAALEQADAVIAIGDEAVASQYRPRVPLVRAIDNSAMAMPAPALDTKDFARARKSFLYLGSWGFINKGLDLVLETFASLPDVHVWVCGPIDQRKDLDFLREYRKELFRTPNIHPLGWTDVHSETFRKLAHECGSLVFPSCSEGMSGSVLDAMARGLIPVVTPECRVAVNGFGVTIGESSVQGVRDAVLRVADADPEECRRMAVESHLQAATRYTLSAFAHNIEHAIGEVLSGIGACSPVPRPDRNHAILQHG